MSPTPPLHVHTLTPDRLANHLESDSPFNACVTTLTTTAILMGNLSILDDTVKQLDYSPHFRTGTTRFKNARVVRMRLRSKRGVRSLLLFKSTVRDYCLPRPHELRPSQTPHLATCH